MIPTAGGYLVEVQVQKELEDLPRPERARAATSAVAFAETLDRLTQDGLTDPPETLGWIVVGRDLALEQRILSDLERRFGLGG